MLDTLYDVILVSILIFPIVTWGRSLWTAYTTPYIQRKIIKQNILYVIAHPDDEAMFFVPSIINLRQNNNLFLLCLSNGNADGLGKIREKELEASANYLGFQEVDIVDDPELQDGMKSYWDPAIVKKHVAKYLKGKQGENEITFIVTFDEHGISSHPNHIATHKGVAKVFEEESFVFDVLTLTTVNIVRKYMFYADIGNCYHDQLNYFKMHPLVQYGAMRLHKSQFVWYRKLFTIFSRYAYANSFEHYAHDPTKYNKKK